MTTTVFVYTINRLNAPGKWSRYVFPFPVDYFAQLGDSLYIRSGDDVLKVSANALSDYAGDPSLPSRSQVFDGIVQWNWLDDGQPGEEKSFDGIDVVGNGAPYVSMGYDQTQPLLFTEEYLVPPDSIPGALIPMPIMCPSCSVKLRYPGGQRWKVQSVNLWVNDNDGRP